MALKNWARLIKTKYGDVLIEKMQSTSNNENGHIHIQYVIEQKTINEEGFTCTCLIHLPTMLMQERIFIEYNKEMAMKFINDCDK